MARLRALAACAEIGAGMETDGKPGNGGKIGGATHYNCSRRLLALQRNAQKLA